MSLQGNTQLIAGGEEHLSAVLEMLNKEGFVVDGNPDVFVRMYTHFGIDEARELRDRANTKALSGSRRVFVVVTPGMTSDAQNALLKTLEEPPGNSLFFILTPSPDTLLATLRSRTQMLRVAGKSAASSVNVRDFLVARPEKRLDMLKVLLEKGDDDRRDMNAILAFLTALEQALVAHPEAVRPIYTARMYIADKGALIKPLLEQVALRIPVVR